MKPVRDKLSQQELETLMLEVLRKSGKALQVREIVKQLPRPYRMPEAQALELLSHLQQTEVIFPWGVARERTLYSTLPLSQHARRSMLQLLHEPLTLAQVKAKTKSRLRGCPPADAGKLVTRILKDLLDEAAIVKVPKVAERYVLAEIKPSFEEALGQLRQNFSHLHSATVRTAILQAFAPDTPLSERILEAIAAVEPRAHEGGLASISQVRRHLSPAVPKKEFDAALLQLGRDGVLSIHEFYGHLQIGEHEREELVFDERGGYYGGVTFQRR